MKSKTIKSFASALSKCNKTTTSVVSQKIKSNMVDCKAPVLIRKPLGSPEKFLSSELMSTATKISDISNTTVAYDPPKPNNLSIMAYFLHHSFMNFEAILLQVYQVLVL